MSHYWRENPSQTSKKVACKGRPGLGDLSVNITATTSFMSSLISLNKLIEVNEVAVALIAMILSQGKFWNL